MTSKPGDSTSRSSKLRPLGSPTVAFLTSSLYHYTAPPAPRPSASSYYHRAPKVHKALMSAILGLNSKLAVLSRSRRSGLFRPTLSKLILSLTLVVGLWKLYAHYTWVYSFPPLYPELSKKEWRLPQHDEHLAFPEGKNGELVRSNF